MSQRGSFVTEYIYCEKCADAVEAVLCAERHKYLCAQRLAGYSDPQISIEGGEGWKLPIIAGKVGGLYDGEESHVFEFELIPQLAEVVCHPVTFAVLPESCYGRVETFRVVPKRADG